MSAAELAHQVAHLWEQGFSDVPWIDQPLTLSTGAFGVCANQWRLYVDGGSGSYQIDAFADGKSIDETLFSVSMDEGDGAIVVSIDAALTGHLSLVLRQSGEPRLARLLCLARSSCDSDNVVVFNSMDREKALLDALKDKLQSHAEPIAAMLLQALSALVRRDVAALLASIEVSERTRNAAGLLKPMLARYQLEHNAHGIKRTFRFWSDAEKKLYLQEVAALMAYLQGVAPGRVALGFGAVLGHVRDQDLIAHDDDLDILIAFDASEVPTLSMALQRIKAALKDSRWKVQGRFFSHLWVGMPSGLRADVFVGLREEGDVLSFYPSARRSLQMADVFPPVDAQLCGVTVPFPASQERYIAATYGSDWRMPKVGFSHPWDRAAFRDIAGPVDSGVITTRGEMMARAQRAKHA